MSAELLISLVQLLPCVVLAPLIGSVSERWPPARALAVGYTVQAVAIGAVGAAMAAASPAWVVFALSPLTTLSFCITRPSQSALLPSVVRTAEELTAANVLTGWTEGVAGLVGPGLAGVLLAWRGTAAATVAMALLVAASTLFVVRVIEERPPPPSGRPVVGGADQHDPAPRAGARAHVAATLRNPHLRVLLVLTLFFYVLVGALDYLCVVLALGLLHMGPGGAGYLNAALGVGELAAGLVTAFLVGRHPLAPTLLGSLLGSVAALALVAVWPRAGVALAVFVVVGLTLAVFNATSKTLMQRAVPADAIAGSFAVVESLMNLGLAVGSVLIWVGVRAVGARASSWPRRWPPCWWWPRCGGDCTRSTPGPRSPRSRSGSWPRCGSSPRSRRRPWRRWPASSR